MGRAGGEGAPPDGGSNPWHAQIGVAEPNKGTCWLGAWMLARVQMIDDAYIKAASLVRKKPGIGQPFKQSRKTPEEWKRGGPRTK